MVAKNIELFDIVAEVESSVAFLEFNKENPHHYLVHVFSTAVVDGDSTQIVPLELGYYGEDTDMITVFHSSPIRRIAAEPVFKEQGALQPLVLTAVQLGLSQAVLAAEVFRKQHYPQHPTMRMICVLQQHDVPVWNITVVTSTLHMVNLKIDAIAGVLQRHELQSLMSLDIGDKT